MFKTRHIERYILGALLPYAALALLILTFILLAQQFAKFSEILGSTRAPFALALEVTAYLLPSVLVFTLPMAMLVGTATGFCRLGSDSELTAMRAAGIGVGRVVAPVLLLGALISALTLEVAFEMAPTAAAALREAGIKAAIQKLESPVDPRSFYTDLPGKVIYVRDGDQETGNWGRVFIHWQENDGQLRLVTARSGRIDTGGEQAELALTDAQITTLPAGGIQGLSSGASVTTEHSAHLRVRDDRLNAGRVALLKRMRNREAEPDEMDWRQLIRYTRGAGTSEQQLLAQIAFHKRLTLCLAPLVFALLGSGMGLRVRRGGRALGIALSLAAMLIYYLVSLAGEQLAKSGAANPVMAIWMPFLTSLICGLMFLSPRTWGRIGRQGLISVTALNLRSSAYLRNSATYGQDRGRLKEPIFKGLLDRTVLLDLSRYYVGTFAALTLIFLIFTLFELLRYIVVNAASGQLVVKYLIFLLPLVSMTVAPMSMLLTVLITYSVMMRRSEIIAWWGSGQSIYRIVTPALIFAGVISFCFWAVQERVMPAANRRQNQLRAQIKGQSVTWSEALFGRQWLASENTGRIYAYSFESSTASLKNAAVFEFDAQGVHLQKVWWSENSAWSADDNASLEFTNALLVELKEGRITSSKQPLLSVKGEQSDVFKPSLNSPAEMNSQELSAYIRSLKTQQVSSNSLSVALERKRAVLLDPLVMALIGAPASLIFGRRSTVVALCVAVMLGVIFWSAISTFSHFGVEGLLSAKLAAWGPSFLFSVIGLYLLLRVRT